ncbi:MAG: hypothetical protein RI894_2140 [Bacteroidota bacterium]
MKKATIIGAGLVGSLWSIFLAKRGYNVSMYERRSDMRKAGYIGGRSINLALSLRGFRGLERAGIADEIKAVALPMYGRMIHDLAGNLAFQPYGKEGEAIYSVSRGGLNIALINLAEKLPNININFDCSCEDVNLQTAELSFLQTAENKAFNLQSDLVFATDGAFSAVRTALQKRPRFNFSQQYENYGYKELVIPAGENNTFLLDKHALHIWPRGHFMLMAMANLDGSFTCTLYLPYEGEHSFENLKTDEQITAFFATYFADAQAMMPTLLADFHENPIGVLTTMKCRPWSFQHKIMLLGDAAHAIVPFYGQGMNAGFEDCVLLDDMMTDFNENWDAIMTEYDRTRPDDTDSIAELALRNFVEMRDKVGDPRFLLRQKIAAWLYQQFPADFTPLYSLVTFSHTPYSVALREGKAQDVLFEQILNLPNIENDWQNETVISVFKTWQSNKG